MSNLSFPFLCVSATLRETLRRLAPVMTLVCLVATNAFAKDPTVETVLDKLHDPRGVAVRPGGAGEQYEVFVSDAGAGRIVKVRNDEPASIADAVTDFDAKTGPSALMFIDRDHLVVGSNDDATIRMYELADQPAPLSANSPKQAIDATDISKVETVLAFARTRSNDNVPDMLIVAATGQGSAGSLCKIPIRAGTLGKIAPLADLPAGHFARGVAVGEPGYIAVSRSDSSTNPTRDSLTFYEPAHGNVVVSFPVSVHQLRELAYHPTNDQLYALVDSSNGEPSGLYRLDDASQPGKPGCKAVKIAAINNPTALAFAPDGTLYVTTSNNNQGQLLRIRGEL